MLIIVIVALNWSPIDHGLSGGTNRDCEGTSPPTRLESSGAMMSTIVMADTVQTRCLPNEEDDVQLDTRTKQGAGAV